MKQNYVPVVKKLSSKNVSGSDLENIVITVQSDPEFAVTIEHSLLKGGRFNLCTIHIRLIIGTIFKISVNKARAINIDLEFINSIQGICF